MLLNVWLAPPPPDDAKILMLLLTSVVVLIFCKSWGVYFEGQNYKFDTIVLAWGDDGLYGEGWTQLSDAVADIVGGGFESFIDIKNAFRMNADKLKIKIAHHSPSHS
jgi:hypothetical protein